MRATRPHGGRDQYGIGRKANSSRPESNRLSHPDSNFYSIRAFTLSIKSSLDYGECRNCENRKSRPGGLDRSSVKRPASGLLRLQERPSGLAPCWLKSRYCSADKCTTLSMGSISTEESVRGGLSPHAIVGYGSNELSTRFAQIDWSRPI